MHFTNVGPSRVRTWDNGCGGGGEGRLEEELGVDPAQLVGVGGHEEVAPAAEQVAVG